MEKYDDNETKKRRERIATAVFARLVETYTTPVAAVLSVQFADALIAELDKEPTR